MRALALTLPALGLLLLLPPASAGCTLVYAGATGGNAGTFVGAELALIPPPLPPDVSWIPPFPAAATAEAVTFATIQAGATVTYVTCVV